MNNIIYLEEIRIKKDLKRARNALCEARALIAKDEFIPKNILEQLENTIDVLEDKLKNYILGEI